VTIDNQSNRDCLTWELEELLRHRFGLEHNTIQIEGPDFHDPRVCPLNRREGGVPNNATASDSWRSAVSNDLDEEEPCRSTAGN